MYNILATKWNELSAPAKSSLAFLFAIVFTKGIIFITTPIFTRIMPEADIGIVGTYNSWKGIYETFSILSITSAGVFNVGMSQFKKCRDEYISSIIVMIAVIAGSCGIILIVFSSYLSEVFNIPKSLFLLMALYSIIMPAETFWISKQRYEYNYKAAFAFIIIFTIFSQGNAIFAVYLFSANLAEIRLWATAVIELPVGVFFIILLIKRGKVLFNKNIWKSTFLLALPLIPHYLASVVLTASDRIMIYNLDSADNAGIYSVAYGIGAIGSIVWGAIQGSLTPYIYDKLDEKRTDGINETCKKVIVIFGIICFGICILAPEVMRIMGPKSYSVGAYAIPAIVGAIYISCLYNLFALVEFYYKKTFFIAFASCVAAGVNLILNWLLIPIFGFVAAGYTTLISYLVLTIMHYLNMKRIEVYSIYKAKELFVISFIFIALCILTVFIYKFYIVRYIIGAILLFVAFIKRKTIRKVIGRKC